jgi:hypothetical protein
MIFLKNKIMVIAAVMLMLTLTSGIFMNEASHSSLFLAEHEKNALPIPSSEDDYEEIEIDDEYDEWEA